jgi:epoxyqueuosine reductase QueG
MTASLQLRDELTSTARADRIDLVGVAAVDRFESVHYRRRPAAHLPGARAVVVLAMRYPKALWELAGRTPAESYMSMSMADSMGLRTQVCLAALDVSRVIEDHGFAVIPMPIDAYRVHPYKDIPDAWHTPFDNDVAAAAAGLGELGLHGKLITPQFGTRQQYTSVVTDAPLEPDPLYEGPALCDRCGACTRACLMHAFKEDAVRDVAIGTRVFQVCQRDWWRCMWSQRFHLNADMGPKFHGMDVTVDPPDSAITDADVKQALQVKGEKGGLQTWYTYAMRECERACVPPHLREQQ